MLSRSVLLYESNVYFKFVTPNQVKRLQVFQNKLLRRILNAPWFVRNNQIHRETDTLEIKHFISQSFHKQQLSSSFAENALVRELIDILGA
ncbi:hypothetical protein GWI33_002463 [Rhynchophorus ferrugineus]|uniref:Uncharacterized protein n=1 Tax=Rhynchophorus ferrugineus TaxID=354439 RepID=A0A834ML12_RHYFE|nr:hypothetical protein GWI33_002463 [Rhynchophorus ferrugineus]